MKILLRKHGGAAMLLLFVYALSIGAVKAESLPAPEPDQANDIALTLENAVAPGKPLTIYVELQKDKPGPAAAVARKFNGVSHEADASGLRVEGDRLKGEVKVQLQPDGYVPDDHQPVSCSYQIDARIGDGGEITGSFDGVSGETRTSGSVSGIVEKHSIPGAAELEIVLNDAAKGGREMKPWKRGANLDIAVKDGKPVMAKLRMTGSPTYAVWTAEITRQNLQLKGNALTGEVEAQLSSTDVQAGRYLYRVEARIFGSDIIAAVTGPRWMARMSGRGG